MANNNTIVIKNATIPDLEAINKLLRLSKAHWGYDNDFLDRFMENFSVNEEQLQKTTTRLFYVDEQLAGLFGFKINEDGKLELDNFFLHPDYIGKGLGLELWQACCNTANELGKNEFIIWSDPNAESFYLKMGCEKIGVRKSPMMPDRYPSILKYKLINSDKYLIKTARLGFRLIEEVDIDYLHPLESDPEVKQFFPGGAKDRAKTEDMINRFMTTYIEKGIPCFLIFDLESGEFIGRAGFGLAESNEIEVGYVLHKKFWDKGIATEAVTALLEYARKHIDVDYIIAYADTGNMASTRVMEKCGMVYYKTAPAKGIECKFYKISNHLVKPYTSK